MADDIPAAFERCEPALSAIDLDRAEARIGHALPDAFRQHYRHHNGGIPVRPCFPGDDDWESMTIASFFPIRYNAATNDLDRSLLDGKYLFLRDRDVIPDALLPFANDHGGNFFALDLKTGAVCFYATDSFDPQLTPAENHDKSRRALNCDFAEFLAKLQDDDDADW